MKKFLVGILSALMLVGAGVIPMRAFDGIHAVSPWLPLDTGPAPWSPTVDQNPSAHSSIVSSFQADLTWVEEEENSELGTSLETNNLGLSVEDGSVVSVNYELIDGADPSDGSVRLFLYFDGGTSTPGNRPATAPDYMAFAPVGPTSGTLSVITDEGTIGYMGLVYDTSNGGGVEGTVRFTNLSVNEELVSFLPEPTPAPTTDVCANIDGDQAGVPDGLHLDASGQNCVAFQFGGAPPPPAGAVLAGQVLGATTLGATGGVEENIFLALFALGSILVGTGVRKLGVPRE